MNDLGNHRKDDATFSDPPRSEEEGCEACPVPVDTGIEIEEPAVADEEAASDDLEDRLALMTENWQRERAQFLNYKKRIEEEKSGIRKYACYDFARDIIRVMDYFESSISFEENLPEESRSVIIGVKYTLDELIRVLAEHGVSPIQAEEGRPFDSSCMEAVERKVVNDIEAGTILKVQRKGWRLHDRVLRPCMVVVSVAPDLEKENENGKEVN